MKALTCEMCGSTNLLKQDGVFVCQSCGTKYSVEEAKKMMVEGTVDVQGTVKVDTSDELKNLYEIARRAKESDNNENAAKYYDMILVKDPSSWEANFYVVYYKAMGCTIAQISNAACSVANCLQPVLDLIQSKVPENDQDSVLDELYVQCSRIAHMFANAAERTFLDADLSYRYEYYGEFSDRVLAAESIMLTYAELLETRFGDKYGKLYSNCFKDSIDLTVISTKHAFGDKSGMQDLINDWAKKINKYDPSYSAPSVVDNYNSPIASTQTSSGCYVATCVYGSYDCPEVWTLRRFRDYTLDETWYGRAFIRAYYATSPTIVKWFGNTNWFKSLWRKVLDTWVCKLNKNGVQNTPYNDKEY